MSDQKPSIGCIVHYQSYGTPGGEYLPQPRAAIVTAIYPDSSDSANFKIDAAVVNPTGLFFTFGLPFAEEPTPGHWNWPPRV